MSHEYEVHGCQQVIGNQVSPTQPVPHLDTAAVRIPDLLQTRVHCSPSRCKIAEKPIESNRERVHNVQGIEAQGSGTWTRKSQNPCFGEISRKKGFQLLWFLRRYGSIFFDSFLIKSPTQPVPHWVPFLQRRSRLSIGSRGARFRFREIVQFSFFVGGVWGRCLHPTRQRGKGI